MRELLWDQVVVKTLYEGNIKGSGIILQTDKKNYSYLITAWHCLDKKESVQMQKIQISRQIKGKMNLLDVVPIEISINPNYDIAIVKLELLNELPMVRMSSVSYKERVEIVGFPKAMQNGLSRTERFPLSAEVIEIPENNIMTLNSMQPLETLSQSAIDVVSCYSGSGIFKVTEGETYLCGIIIELGSPEGAFGALRGITSECIQMTLRDKGWDTLCDIDYCSFDVFKEQVIEIFEEPMDRICALQMPNIRNSVKPSDIKMHCGKKLIWPYSENNLNNAAIWEGWLLYLIFRSLESQDNLQDEKYYTVDSVNGKRKVKLIYVTNKTRLSDFLKDYLENDSGQVSKDAFLIIKTKKEPQTKMLQSSQINKVVKDISNVISKKEELRIDNVETSIRKLSLIHIGKMVEELNVILEDFNEDVDDENDLEKKLGRRIGEMLNEF
ncbi:MAG: ABC-three component system protein [Eubacteriales bacterium]